MFERSGFDTLESCLLFSVCSMDVMINAPMTCTTLNRLQKSDGQTVKKNTNKQTLNKLQKLFLFVCLLYV